MADMPTVCIIGAGVSGLTAGKALGDFGVPYTCFEASDDIGGNWYFGNPNGASSAYKSLHIDISKPSISFRDFPMPDRYPDYPHHTHIFEWLRDYADAFGQRMSASPSFSGRSSVPHSGQCVGISKACSEPSSSVIRQPPCGLRSARCTRVSKRMCSRRPKASA